MAVAGKGGDITHLLHLIAQHPCGWHAPCGCGAWALRLGGDQMAQYEKLLWAGLSEWGDAHVFQCSKVICSESTALTGVSSRPPPHQAADTEKLPPCESFTEVTNEGLWVEDVNIHELWFHRWRGMFLSLCVMTGRTTIRSALKASALKWKDPLKSCMQGFIN